MNHVTISCFLQVVPASSWQRSLLSLFHPRGNQLFCLQVVPAPTWQSSLLSLTVFIPPTWQSAVLSAGGPGTYLAEFCIVFIPPTWQSAVLSAGGPGTTWQSSLLSLIVFFPPTWRSAVLCAGGPGTYLAKFCIIFDCIYSSHVAMSCFVCRWSRHYLAEF
jgi:hypothetical protein